MHTWDPSTLEAEGGLQECKASLRLGLRGVRGSKRGKFDQNTECESLKSLIKIFLKTKCKKIGKDR